MKNDAKLFDFSFMRRDAWSMARVYTLLCWHQHVAYGNKFRSNGVFGGG